MAANYQKVWDTMNELEMTVSKVSSAREILDSAIEALENHKLDKAEALMYAANEFLGYYLQEFDGKFKDAWTHTVGSFKENKEDITPKVVEENLEELLDKAEKFYHKAGHNILTYQEAIDAGYSMTDDGFWVPPEKEKDLYVYEDGK